MAAVTSTSFTNSDVNHHLKGEREDKSSIDLRLASLSLARDFPLDRCYNPQKDFDLIKTSGSADQKKYYGIRLEHHHRRLQTNILGIQKIIFEYLIDPEHLDFPRVKDITTMIVARHFFGHSLPVKFIHFQEIVIDPSNPGSKGWKTTIYIFDGNTPFDGKGGLNREQFAMVNRLNQLVMQLDPAAGVPFFKQTKAGFWHDTHRTFDQLIEHFITNITRSFGGKNLLEYVAALIEHVEDGTRRFPLMESLNELFDLSERIINLTDLNNETILNCAIRLLYWEIVEQLLEREDLDHRILNESTFNKIEPNEWIMMKLELAGMIPSGSLKKRSMPHEKMRVAFVKLEQRIKEGTFQNASCRRVTKIKRTK